MEPHLQGPNDHDGGDRPGRPSQRRARSDGGGKLSRQCGWRQDESGSGRRTGNGLMGVTIKKGVMHQRGAARTPAMRLNDDVWSFRICCLLTTHHGRVTKQLRQWAAFLVVVTGKSS